MKSKELAGIIGALVVLLAIVATVRHVSTLSVDELRADPTGGAVQAIPHGLGGTTTTAAFLLLGAWLTGELFRRLHLPRVSGYLIFGVLVGPELAPLLPDWAPTFVPAEQMPYLKLVDALAISMIALIAGSEIKIEFLRAVLRRVSIILSVEVVIVIAGLSVPLMLLRGHVQMFEDLDLRTITILSLVIGTFAVANSPAVVIAMIRETKSDGPMARTALAVTVFKDLVLIILVAALLATASAMLFASGAPDEAVDNGSLAFEIIWHLAGSIVAGGILGVIMHGLARRMGGRLDLFVVASGFFIAIFSNAVHFSPLLVGLAAGFVQANLWRHGTERLFHAIEELSLPVYCLFFAVTGAGIRVQTVIDLWPLAVSVVLWRMALIFSAVQLGNRLAGFSVEGRWLWTALIPQAGVSIALAAEIGRTFDGQTWAPTLTSVLLAIVAFNEVIGPPLMRLGLARSGEIRE